MRYIVTAVPEREAYVAALADELPDLEIVRDSDRSAMTTFLQALALIGRDGAVLLQDDVLLTSDFRRKAEAVIDQHVTTLVQFFSMRQSDLKLGSRRQPGRRFLALLCVYLPPAYADAIASYYPRWPKRGGNFRGWVDVMVRDWLVEHRLSYWLHSPSLVQHRQVRSVIDPRRSSRRQSPSFVP